MFFALGLLFLMICCVQLVQAADNDAAAAKGNKAAHLTNLPPDFPLLRIVADETMKQLKQRGMSIDYLVTGPSTVDQQPPERPHLLLAGLDTFISRWAKAASDEQEGVNNSTSTADTDDNEDTEGGTGADQLLTSLQPIAGLVRDHQAFLMKSEHDVQKMLARIGGASGAMSIGGLSPKRHKDHLVAMMLLDAAGANPVDFSYRQYESLSALVQGLIADEVQVLSIPVSQALQLPFNDSIALVATSGDVRQNVTIDVPTLLESQIDMQFTNYIGLYMPAADNATTEGETIKAFVESSPVFETSSQPQVLRQFGLVDEHVDEGDFAANVLRQLSTLRTYADMLGS